MAVFDPWVYVNGRWRRASHATVSVLDHGLLYGDGLFETMRAYHGTLFRQSAHLDRLLKSAHQIYLSAPSKPVLASLLDQTLSKNVLQDAILRVTLTRGKSEGWGAPCGAPSVLIMPRPLPDVPAGGLSAIVIKNRRHAAATEITMKSTSFIGNILCRIEAQQRGAQDGLFLNTEGYLTEATTSNLFWITDGVLQTPSQENGILPGITRHEVIRLAKRSKIPVKEGCYPLDVLLHADEAFLTNSASELMPLVDVEGYRIGGGHPGVMTLNLHRMFQKEVKRVCVQGCA